MLRNYFIMRILLLFFCCLNFVVSNGQEKKVFSSSYNYKLISTEVLKDKIKGGWAGQTIGVTFGAPYEFKFNGTFIQDYQPLPWEAGYLKNAMINHPGVYDDIYVDLTFVNVIEKYGLQAPADSFASALANADFELWHANQAARYNYLNGLKAPESGHWVNNPHADDIDFQIESDFSGLMSPGMPVAASHIGDKVGHIMNSGDGWYGGIFVGAMYAHAFFSDDLNFIINEALKMIPSQSDFYKCIKDVIGWHRQYPNDWHQTWFEIQKKWSSDVGCPDGVFNAFNIDAKINAAYVVMGLLYGNKDFGKTLEIATRAGQDADCNPSTAGGVLGTVLGYQNMPAYWRQGLKEVEDLNFKFTTMSLNDAYRLSYVHALEMIRKNGGRIDGEKIWVKYQQSKPVKFEKNFDGLVPSSRRRINRKVTDSATINFIGKGVVLTGHSMKPNSEAKEGMVCVSVTVDNGKPEVIKLPTDFLKRRTDIFWKYDLTNSPHVLSIKIDDAPSGYYLVISDVLSYKAED